MTKLMFVKCHLKLINETSSSSHNSEPHHRHLVSAIVLDADGFQPLCSACNQRYEHCRSIWQIQTSSKRTGDCRPI